MFRDVNDVIIGRKTVEQIVAEEKDAHDNSHDDSSGDASTGSGGESTSRQRRMNQMERL